MVARSGGGAALATIYVRAGFQPATAPANSVTDPRLGVHAVISGGRIAWDNRRSRPQTRPVRLGPARSVTAAALIRRTRPGGSVTHPVTLPPRCGGADLRPGRKPLLFYTSGRGGWRSLVTRPTMDVWARPDGPLGVAAPVSLAPAGRCVEQRAREPADRFSHPPCERSRVCGDGEKVTLGGQPLRGTTPERPLPPHIRSLRLSKGEAVPSTIRLNSRTLAWQCQFNFRRQRKRVVEPHVRTHA